MYKYRRVISSAALLTVIGNPVFLKSQEPRCDVRGVYRPFTLIRQFKLAAAYFVDPALPDEARILNAYSLPEAIDKKGKDWILEQVSRNAMELHASLSDDEDVSVMAQIPGPCESSAGSGDVPEDSLSEATSYRGRVVYDGRPWTEWLDGLSSRVHDDVYLVSEQDLIPGAGDRFVSWAPGKMHACALLADGGVKCWGQRASQ